MARPRQWKSIDTNSRRVGEQEGLRRSIWRVTGSIGPPGGRMRVRPWLGTPYMSNPVSGGMRILERDHAAICRPEVVTMYRDSSVSHVIVTDWPTITATLNGTMTPFMTGVQTKPSWTGRNSSRKRRPLDCKWQPCAKRAACHTGLAPVALVAGFIRRFPTSTSLLQTQ